jgi:hypothetical protein
MLRRVTTVLAVLLAAPSAAPSDSTPPKRFVKAAAEGKANLATPAGQEFDRVLVVRFGEANGPIMKACFDKTEAPDARAFDLVLRLSDRGRVLDGLVWPETNIAVCFRDALRTRTFPSPPAGEYWIFVAMHFDP